jgi:hypothetical protein
VTSFRRKCDKPIGYLGRIRGLGLVRDILICGDILRANLELTHRPYNTRWFSALIRNAIAPLGIKSEVLGHCPPNFSFDDFYKSIYLEAGEAVLDKWADFYDARSFSRDMSARLFDLFSDRIVILFEGSRSILRYISSIGGVYLNFRVSPLRFACDLVFVIESNDSNVQAAIKQFELKQEFVDAQKIALRNQIGQSVGAFTRPSLVFLGQVRGDASLIHNGRFTNIAIPSELDVNRFSLGDVYHKPHPLDVNELEIERWKSFFPNSQRLNMPTYAAFCSKGDVTFVSVSSGSGYEAQLLGHDCHFVSPHNWSMGSPRWDRFTSVLYEYRFEGFWRAIFAAVNGAPLDKDAIAASQLHMRFKPESLRGAIDAKWAHRSLAKEA